MTRLASLVLVVAACGSSGSSDEPDAAVEADAPVADASPDTAASSGFGTLTGMCGVLNNPELMAGTAPLFVRDTIAFPRAYMDPADRPLLTAGGQRLAATPNAGGSSGLSEIFAFEQLARCEDADLLKTETEIVYATSGKITDMLVTIDGHKIGVSVTRAVAFPFGTPYSVADATTLLQRKLEDIQASTANVSAADKWDKQILSYLAFDAAAADSVATAWGNMSANVRADTIVLVTVTDGADEFIYTNQ